MDSLLKEVYPKRRKVPFKSEAQRRFLWKNEPEVAERWAHKYNSGKGLPKRKMQSAAKRKVKKYGEGSDR